MINLLRELKGDYNDLLGAAGEIIVADYINNLPDDVTATRFADKYETSGDLELSNGKIIEVKTQLAKVFGRPDDTSNGKYNVHYTIPFIHFSGLVHSNQIEKAQSADYLMFVPVPYLDENTVTILSAPPAGQRNFLKRYNGEAKDYRYEISEHDMEVISSFEDAEVAKWLRDHSKNGYNEAFARRKSWARIY